MRGTSDLDEPDWPPQASGSAAMPGPLAEPFEPGAGAASRQRRGLHLGPIRITPARVFLTIALVGGLAFLAWSTFVRDQLQIPLMASGFAICGLVFAVIAILCVGEVLRAGRDGRDGRAVGTALFGGLVAVAAFGCVAGALIMGLIWGTTK